jgi:hypothetical protein
MSWISDIFRAGQVNSGNVVRRNMHDVAEYGGVLKLEQEVRNQGFHMALIGEQYVIVCNTAGSIQIIC